MFELDPMVAAAIFFSSFFLDLIAARYTSDVVSLRAGRAASLSFLWHMLSAIVVIQYAHNAFYILFVCLGGGLGTYFTIWSTRRAATAAGRVEIIPESVIESAIDRSPPAPPERFALAHPRGPMPKSRTVRSGTIARRCVPPTGRVQVGAPAGGRRDCTFEGPRAPS